MRTTEEGREGGREGREGRRDVPQDGIDGQLGEVGFFLAKELGGEGGGGDVDLGGGREEGREDGGSVTLYWQGQYISPSLPPSLPPHQVLSKRRRVSSIVLCQGL